MTESIHKFRRRIAAPWGLTAEGNLKRNVLIEFTPDMVVSTFEYGVSDLDSVPFVEYYNGILIPSLVNAHCHLELSFLRGAISDKIDEGLVGFFGNLSALRSMTNEEDIISAARYQDSSMWSEGVSAVGDISNNAFSFSVKADSKIKYRTFAEYYGFGCQGDVESYVLKKIGKLLDEGRSLGLDVSASPHSTYLVSDQPFRYAGNMDTVSIHFMESRAEEGFFSGKGKMYDFVNSSFPGKLSNLRYSSPADRIIRSFPRDIRLLLVHCTNVQCDDVKKILDYFNDVTFVLCPCSNMFIEGTLPPAKMLLESGCRIAIGTDSLASNSSLCMAREIEQLCHCGIPLNEILHWATSGGAVALGYQNELGSFEIGKRSGGAALITGVDLNTMEITDMFKIKRIV